MSKSFCHLGEQKRCFVLYFCRDGGHQNRDVCCYSSIFFILFFPVSVLFWQKSTIFIKLCCPAVCSYHLPSFMIYYNSPLATSGLLVKMVFSSHRNHLLPTEEWLVTMMLVPDRTKHFPLMCDLHFFHIKQLLLLLTVIRGRKVMEQGNRGSDSDRQTSVPICVQCLSNPKI